MEELSIHISKFGGKIIIACNVPLKGEGNNISPLLEKLKEQLKQDPKLFLSMRYIDEKFPENRQVLSVLGKILENRTVEEVSGINWNTINGKNILITIY